MKYTNKHQISKINYDLLAYDDHPKRESGVLFVTDLPNGIRETVLKDRHPGLQVDATERINIIMGIALHKMRREIKTPGKVVGKRITATVGGVDLSGEFDALMPMAEFPKSLLPQFGGMLQGHAYYIDDLKQTKVWPVKKGLMDRSFRIQLLGYKFLLHLDGTDIAPVGIISAWFKDHTYRDAGDFPVAIAELPYDIGLNFKAIKENMVIPKVQQYIDCSILEDIELPMCTQEERWQNDTKCKYFCNVRKVCELGRKYQ